MFKAPQKVCEEYIQKFANVGKSGENNEDSIRFILSHPKIRRKLDEWVAQHDSAGGDEVTPHTQNRSVSSKNSERCAVKKEEGNKLFKKKLYRQSLICYNEALRLAEFSNGEESEKIALCFGNRSAAYYELGTPDDLQRSLADIGSALKYGYPDQLKVKLFLRQVNIYLKLGKVDQAYDSFRMASNCQNVSAEQRSKLSSLQSELDNLSSLKDNNLKSDIDEQTDQQTSESKIPGFTENPLFEGASSPLTIHYSNDKTRYVKCTSNLKFGDILFFEEPFVSILIPEYYESHCFHCHCILRNDYFFPCCQCSQVKFCQESCFLTAWETYHKYECGFLGILNSVGIAHLALKVVLVAGLRDVLKMRELKRDTSDTSIFKKGAPPYSRVFSLLDHMDKMHGEDLFQYSLTAGLLLNYLLKNTSFFDGASDDEIYKTGGILLKHICQLICNAHAITYIASDADVPAVSTVSQEMQVRIASAIYPSASMMNHSCEPCIASSFFKGRKLVVRATANIVKGSEIFNCYGPHARRMKRQSRQEVLAQQYFFNCDCTFCTKEAEDGYSFVDKFHALRCSKCSGPVIPDLSTKSILVECQDCGQNENIENKIRSALRIDKLITSCADLWDKERASDALTALLEGYRLCKQDLYQFNGDFGYLCDLLGRCHTTLDNFEEAVRYVKQSVKYIKERFGDSSIEYARGLSTLHELVSLSTLSAGEQSWIKLAKEKSEKILQLYIYS